MLPSFKIAVGSANPVKVAAVRDAVSRVWPAARLISLAVPSGVGAMPMSDAECLLGARNRARAARAAVEADLGIGLEGGVNAEPSGLMLLGWVAVLAEDGREGVAATARLPLPASIARRIQNGEELGPVMDDVLNEENTRQKGGAVGALTAGLVLRREAFAMAVAYALSPFVAPELHVK
ncbi:MAG: inosine/xanthosine triphosphatase [Candidatus Promineifilaceae bacterium]|nr:inosine/xanthosine triphosphatase [Candidatus Promineifilaceae bacterium]